MYYLHYNLFVSFVVLFYAFAILSALGVYPNAQKYVETMDYYMRIYICLFLIWRFNPFSAHRFDKLDKQIAFHAGVIILTTTALNKYLTLFRSNLIENAKKLRLL